MIKSPKSPFSSNQITFGSQLNVSFFSYSRRHDSSIGFGAPVRANMRAGGVTNAAVASNLMETVRFIISSPNK